MHNITLSDEDLKLHVSAMDAYIRVICQNISVSQNAALSLKDNLAKLSGINSYLLGVDKQLDEAQS